MGRALPLTALVGASASRQPCAPRAHLPEPICPVPKGPRGEEANTDSGRSHDRAPRRIDGRRGGEYWGTRRRGQGAAFVAGSDTPNVGLAVSGVNAIRADTENAIGPARLHRRARTGHDGRSLPSRGRMFRGRRISIHSAGSGGGYRLRLSNCEAVLRGPDCPWHASCPSHRLPVTRPRRGRAWVVLPLRMGRWEVRRIGEGRALSQAGGV